MDRVGSKPHAPDSDTVERSKRKLAEELAKQDPTKVAKLEEKTGEVFAAYKEVTEGVAPISSATQKFTDRISQEVVAAHPEVNALAKQVFGAAHTI